MGKFVALAALTLWMGVLLYAATAQSHVWYCGHAIKWTSPGAQYEKFGGHYPNGDHHVSTIRVSPSGIHYVVDYHRRICH